MPDPERLLTTLRRATLACRDTPGRRGRTVRLDAADEVLVGGDLHGHVGNFRGLLLRADLGRNPRRHLVLQELIHGPFRYPDGSDKSHQLVDLLAALKCQYPRQVHYLPGNHELAQQTGRVIGKGDEVLNQLFREGVTAAYGAHAGAIYDAYLALFAAAPLAVRAPNRLLISHSLPSEKWLSTFDPAALERDAHDPADLEPGGSVFALAWGRDTAAAHVAAFLAKVDADWLVTGHVPCDTGWEAPNERQIILDCMGSPAGYGLFPADRPLTRDELVGCVRTL